MIMISNWQDLKQTQEHQSFQSSDKSKTLTLSDDEMVGFSTVHDLIVRKLDD